MASFDDFSLLVGRYQATPGALTDGQPAELLLDSVGRQVISGRWLAGTDTWSDGDAGLSALAVRNDAGGPLTGVADQDYTPLQTDATGALRVNATVNVDSLSQYAEDSGHTSGDIGEFILSIRLDDIDGANGAFLAGTEGDYQGTFTDAKGQLWVHDADSVALLTTIDADTSLLADATHLEDSGHTTGDRGNFMLAVRNDADAVLTDADLDYSGIAVDSTGKVKIVGEVSVAPIGTEAYTVTDALAAGEDGCETITALATPWIDVATLDIGAVTTAYLYAYQWAASQNAQMRIISEDTVGGDIIIYKTDVNSSAVPGTSESWSDGGRIEIPGGANLELKMQIKKRQASGGDAQGSGSLHVRTV